MKITNLEKITPYHLGKNLRIITNETLFRNSRQNKYINNESMSALDNYAQHENIKVCILPLEKDLFDDISVSVYKDTKDSKIYRFPMKIEEGKDGLVKFYKTLYENVENCVNEKRTRNIEYVSFKKLTLKEKIDMYLKNLKDRYHAKKLDTIRKIIAKNRYNEDLTGFIANTLEHQYYDELYYINKI